MSEELYNFSNSLNINNGGDNDMNDADEQKNDGINNNETIIIDDKIEQGVILNNTDAIAPIETTEAIETKEVTNEESSDKKYKEDVKTDNYILPLVSYISEAPKSSHAFVKTKTETEFSNNPNDLSQNGYPIKQLEQPKVYHWSAAEENKFQSNRLNISSVAENKKSKKEKKKIKNLGLKIFAAAMSAMFLFTSSSTAYYMLSSKNAANTDNIAKETPVISNSKAVEEDLNAAFENTGITIGDSKSSSRILTTKEVIEKAKPSVVCIEVKSEVVNNFSSFFGRNSGTPQVYEQQSIGTGFILSEDGYIATNYHVIEDSKELKVTLSSGESYIAEIIGGDEAADIAVIKIDAKNLPVAELGNSESLVQGDDVVAIGTPAGIEFAGTATKGIVSAINRDVDVPVGNGFSSKTMTVIQTDASINPGNSGGPLVNDKGQVIGITTMKLSSEMFEGMGFAIPINIAIPVVNDIIDNPGIRNNVSTTVEDTSSVSLGITGGTVTQSDSQLLGIPQGFKISEIVENSPCYNSGIQVSDIIVGFNGKIVTSYEDIIEIKKECKAGDKATITVYRNGDTYDFDIILSAK